ncbi:MAG: hypothetical protein QGH33_01360, partial [Pirellulaceae bacterium]|nr:hypothetical protein [Pirellulaceae bacterium]
MKVHDMAQAKTVAVEVDNQTIQRPWDESDLVTDWSAFPRGYGILLNERLIFPEDLCLWRMKIDTTRQLFVDDYLIAHQRDLKRELHSPQDHPANPVLTHLRGDGLSTAYGQYVCPDEEHGYRMYYGGPGGLIYVAYSTDGIHWDKPDLNVYDHSAEPDRFGGGPNNAVAHGAMHGLLRDSDDPDPQRQWKLITISGQRGTQVTWPYRKSPPSTLLLPVPGLGQVHWPRGTAQDESGPAKGRLHQILTSADGLRWTGSIDTCLPKGPAMFHAPYDRPIGISDVLRVRWDPKLSKFIANIKYFIGPDLRTTPVCHTGRVMAMCESDDLIHWSSPRVYAYPDGEDTKQSGMWGIYEADGFPYESMWLNPFSMTWYHPASREESRRHNLMPTRPFVKRNRIHLAGSRDGRHFYYLGDRRPFIDWGPEGSWKPHYLRMTNVDTVGGPLVKNDELWFYYVGWNIDGSKGTWQQKTGLTILRRDGFASLNAGEEAGVVITRPLVFEGEGKLFVNADVGTNGCVRASVVAEDGSAIDGFG